MYFIEDQLEVRYDNIFLTTIFEEIILWGIFLVFERVMF